MLEIVGDRLEAGVVVNGAYRLERIVGQGGMGVVWAARELSSSRAVALKFLRDGAETDPKQRERFMREARAAMTVVHPNVAKVEAVAETDVGVPFLVMELLEGESLRDVLARRHTLPPAECARLLGAVVDAVSAAHAARIVHRDLKPENVFLVRGSEVRVLDFGIAKRLPAASPPDASGTVTGGALTTTGALIGTPVYMAPEQIFGEEVDPSADVWALGIILYETIAGRRPTDADGFGPIIKRITADPIEPLERVAPSCPPVLARLVARMLTRDRAARPTLTEVKATLDQIADAPASGGDEEAPPRTHRIGPPPNVPTPVHPAPAPKRPEDGLLKQNAVPLAIGGALAFIILLVVTTVAVAVAMLNKEKFESPPPSTSAASASGGIISPKQRSEEAAAALDAARAAQEQRDGAACLAKMDRHDEVSLVFKSTAAGGMYSDLRARCLMLAKRCAEGKGMMRTYLEKKPSIGLPFEDELERIVSEQCEGEDLTPREALLRAAFRLRSMPAPTTAQCDEWTATLDALFPQVPSRGALDKIHADLAKERATLRAECQSRVKRN